MFKGGSGKSGLSILCALFLCLAAGACVKRAPRTAAPPDQAAVEKSASDRPCGLSCKIRQKKQAKKKAGDNKPGRTEAVRDKHKKTPKRKESRHERTAWWRTKDKTGKRQQKGKGVYHTVKKGETFYRICLTYRVDRKEVARINKISNPSRLDVGQRLWIPGAQEVRTVAVAPSGGPGKGNGGGATRGSWNRTPPVTPSPSVTRGTFINPVPKGKTSSGFGARGERMHEGIDLSAPEGSPVLAADDGKVVYEGDEIRGYGNMIIIKHAGNLTTVYAHNRKNLVRNGEFVKRGEKIAEVGQTGRASGPHLHFEVRIGEKPVNPEFYLP
jgi:lipoprotein NlpD